MCDCIMNGTPLVYEIGGVTTTTVEELIYCFVAVVLQSFSDWFVLIEIKIHSNYKLYWCLLCVHVHVCERRRER